MAYQLAQINVGRILGINIDDPIMQEFVDNLDRVNRLAESSEGFVWRLQDDTNNATSFNPYDDAQIIINISVWADVESLKKFVYQTAHVDFLKRKKEWFTKFDQAHTAMWWIKAGDYPSVTQAVERLRYLQTNGNSTRAFNFQSPQPKPH